MARRNNKGRRSELSPRAWGSSVNLAKLQKELAAGTAPESQRTPAEERVPPIAPESLSAQAGTPDTAEKPVAAMRERQRTFRIVRFVGPLSTEQAAWFDRRSALLAETLNGIMGRLFFEPKASSDLYVTMLGRETINRLMDSYELDAAAAEMHLRRSLPPTTFTPQDARIADHLLIPPPTKETRRTNPDAQAFVGIAPAYMQSPEELHRIQEISEEIGSTLPPLQQRIELVRPLGNVRYFKPEHMTPMHEAIQLTFPYDTPVPLQGAAFKTS